MISVVCYFVSTTVTATIGKAFFTAPAGAPVSLLLNERFDLSVHS
jgi:hypothetical protein